MSHKHDYQDKMLQEKMRKNIIKWWNVSVSETTNYIGSPSLRDSEYNCNIYEPFTPPVSVAEPLSDNSFPVTDESVPDNVTEEVSANVDEETHRLANEIYNRLNQEALEDEAKKIAEIDAAKLAYDNSSTEIPVENEAAYNAATGSYSGLYGTKPMSEQEKENFDSIMSNNQSGSPTIDELFAEHENE